MPACVLASSYFTAAGGGRFIFFLRLQRGEVGDVQRELLVDQDELDGCDGGDYEC